MKNWRKKYVDRSIPQCTHCARDRTFRCGEGEKVFESIRWRVKERIITCARLVEDAQLTQFMERFEIRAYLDTPTLSRGIPFLIVRFIRCTHF